MPESKYDAEHCFRVGYLSLGFARGGTTYAFTLLAPQPTIGIGGKPLDEKACLELTACIEKAIMLADTIAAKHPG